MTLRGSTYLSFWDFFRKMYDLTIDEVHASKEFGFNLKTKIGK